MKKFLLIIVVALCLPVTMWAQETTFTVGDLTYKITSDEEVEITKATDSWQVTVFNVPACVEYEGKTYAVTSIEDQGFGYGVWKDNTNVVEITLPSTIKTIGQSAFMNCSSLVRLVINSGGSLPYRACYGDTKLESIILPSNLTTIEEQAFATCTSLFTLIFLNPEPPIFTSDNVFGLSGTSGTMYVPRDSYYAYLYQKENTTNFGNATAWYSLSTFDYADLKLSVTDDENDGYATYYNASYDVSLPNEVDAYAITSVDGNGVLTLENVGNIIPAKTAVLLKGEVGSYTDVPEIVATVSAFSGTNLLYGSDSETTTSVNGVTEGYYFYKLTVDAETQSKLGFYWGAKDGGPFDMPANKAWLAIPRPSQQDEGEDEGWDWPYGVPALKFNFDGEETTGITSVATPATSAPVGIYSLQGVRVSDMSQKGVYIVDGKKVIVK